MNWSSWIFFWASFISIIFTIFVIPWRWRLPWRSRTPGINSYWLNWEIGFPYWVLPYMAIFAWNLRGIKIGDCINWSFYDLFTVTVHLVSINSCNRHWPCVNCCDSFANSECFVLAIFSHSCCVNFICYCLCRSLSLPLSIDISSICVVFSWDWIKSSRDECISSGDSLWYFTPIYNSFLCLSLSEL